MIDRKELRIGNIVAFRQAEKGLPSFHRVVRLEEITARLANFQINNVMYYRDFEYSDIEPISLTTAWLESLGGVDTGQKSTEFLIVSNFTFRQSIIVTIESAGAVALVDKIDEVNSVIVLHNNVCYVHQLQNLYFALTGEELTIKM